jgi:hypothetical protein
VGDGLCTGFAFSIYVALRDPSIHLVCASDNVTTGQLRDVAIKYLRNHPEKRHIAADTLVSLALQDAFLCDGAATDVAIKRAPSPGPAESLAHRVRRNQTHASSTVASVAPVSRARSATVCSVLPGGRAARGARPRELATHT